MDILKWLKDLYAKCFDYIGFRSKLSPVIEQLEKVPYVPYPIAFHTVDIIPIKANGQILLGRKKGNIKFQSMGGFVDPGETAEFAAVREAKEESGIILTEDELTYLGSFFIDDSRYRDSCHKITTSFFVAQTSGEHNEVKGLDDIEEAKWFDLDSLYENRNELVEPLHMCLVEKLANWYWDKITEHDRD